jgi:hypothetical protein
MSRSYTKNTFSRNAQTHSRASEKKDKRIWHQRLRRLFNTRFNNTLADYEYLIIPNRYDVSNICSFAKDGKRYIKKSILKELRNNEFEHRITKNLKFRK